MYEYRYLIEYPDKTCLHLSDEGPRKEPPDFEAKLKEEGFHHDEERPMGKYVLRVYKRQISASDIVPPQI